MSRIPGEYFDEFFAPLVGNADAAEDFKDILADHIAGHEATNSAYAHLLTGASAAINQSITLCRTQFPQTGFRESLRWGSIYANGRSGARFTVAALEAVGDIYARTATVPQEEVQVRENTNRTLRYIFGLAFSGKFVGSLNLEALRHGYNPNSTLQLPVVFARYVANLRSHTDFHKALHATADPASGQVSIRPKHQRMRKVMDRQCPATHSWVDTDASRQSALLLFMRTIGDIAITEIYPHQFSIKATPSQ